MSANWQLRRDTGHEEVCNAAGFWICQVFEADEVRQSRGRPALSDEESTNVPAHGGHEFAGLVRPDLVVDHCCRFVNRRQLRSQRLLQAGVGVFTDLEVVECDVVTQRLPLFDCQSVAGRCLVSAKVQPGLETNPGSFEPLPISTQLKDLLEASV